MKTHYSMKGISPIIATIILIVLTVVAGGFIYTYATGMLHSGSVSQQATVQSATLIPGSGSAATLSVTIQNSGTVAIKNVTIASISNVATLPTTPSPFIGSIAPSSTMSGTATLAGSNPFLAGDTYTMTFVVNFVNGATQDITTSVVASTY